MPPAGEWLLERISRQAFRRVAIAIDEMGALHVAASRRGDVVYLTNAGDVRGWVSQAVGVPAATERHDNLASLAVDESGRIAVAIERSDCHVAGCMAFGGEIYAATTDPTRAWLEAIRLGEGLDPSILLHDGKMHIVYVGGEYSDDVCAERRPVRYATNSPGTWVDLRVTRDGHWGLIGLEQDGDPAVVAGNLCDTLGPEGAFLVRPTSAAPHHLDPLPGITSDDALVTVAVDALDRVHLVYRHWDDTHYYVRRDEAGWTQPVELPSGTVTAMETDGDGVAHVVGFDASHVWHASNATGEFVADLVSPVTAQADYRLPSAIAVDPAGQVHVVFAMPDADGEPTELWHAVSPASGGV